MPWTLQQPRRARCNFSCQCTVLSAAAAVVVVVVVVVDVVVVVVAAALSMLMTAKVNMSTMMIVSICAMTVFISRVNLMVQFVLQHPTALTFIITDYHGNLACFKEA